MTHETKGTHKHLISHRHSTGILTIFLSLILPSTALANGMSKLIYLPIILGLTIILSVTVAVFIKFGLCRLVYPDDIRISIKSFSLVMVLEFIIMNFFTYLLLAFTMQNYDMRVTNMLSYLSIDAALLYFQKVIVEHKLEWSFAGRLLMFAFALPFINFFPNYRLVTKYTAYRLTRFRYWL